MKKSIFFLMASATFVLTSCTTEEAPAPATDNSKQICFRTSLGAGAISRGPETTTGSFDDFKVTALVDGGYYFTEALFSKGADNLYTTATPYLWPGARSVRFIAYSYNNGKEGDANKAVDYSVLGTPTFNATEKALKGFSPNTDVDKQIDLVWADKAATWSETIETSGLELPFNHNLSQIQVQAKTTNDLYTVKIAGIKTGNIVSTGDFNFESGKWVLPDSPALKDYEIIYSSSPITLGANAVDISNIAEVKYMMLLPQQLTPWDKTNAATTNGAYLGVLLNITCTGGDKLQVYPATAGEYGWAYIPVDTQWVEGKRYIYTLDFSQGAGYDKDGKPILGGVIKLTHTVNPWEDGVWTNPDLTQK